MIAHIGGVPVEESLMLLASAGAGVLLGLRVALARVVARMRRGP